MEGDKLLCPLVRRSLKLLARRQGSAREELAESHKGLAAAEAARTKTRSELEARLVTLYKFTTAGGAQSVYSAGDFQSFARLFSASINASTTRSFSVLISSFLTPTLMTRPFC